MTTPISAMEISSAMSKMKKDSSHGWDGIPIALLADAWVPVHLPDGSEHRVHVMVEKLEKLFNVILDTSKVPVDWVRSVITFIAKPGRDTKLAASYRPISVCPTLYRLLFKVLQQRRPTGIH
jgi:hypothetical protein